MSSRSPKEARESRGVPGRDPRRDAGRPQRRAGTSEPTCRGLWTIDAARSASGLAPRPYQPVAAPMALPSPPTRSHLADADRADARAGHTSSRLQARWNRELVSVAEVNGEVGQRQARSWRGNGRSIWDPGPDKARSIHKPAPISTPSLAVC